jgi:hypothetical protein
MAFITADRVKDTSTTTGTGNITVSGSAPFGYRTFSTVLSVSDTFYYAIQGQSTSEWEVGLGTYVSSNQFSRTTVLASSASGSAVSFSSGTKNVFITLPATKTFQLDPLQSIVPGAVLYGTGTSTVGYTAAGTVGQVLTSNAAGAPTWNTVSGTGTVTSVAVRGGSTGLTTSGGPITTSGTITMAGTLAVASGGTGLTSTPANGALDIGNGTGFTRANLTAGANITITNTAGGISIAASGAGTPNTIANGTSSVGIASSNGSIVAATNGTTAMTIDTSQNLGIGTTSPSYRLDVNSGSNFIAGRFTSTSTATIVPFADSTTTGTGPYVGSVANALTFGRVGVSEYARIDSSGYLLVGYASSNGAYKLQVNSQIFATSSTIATSDARYKQNVEALNGALSIVKALRPVSFDWKKHPVHAFDTENTTVGFLAQEVQQVLADKPYLNSIVKKNECVIEPEIRDENGNVTTTAVTEEFLGIAEGNMIAIITSALQELSAKNDALEARLAALEAK